VDQCTDLRALGLSMRACGAAVVVSHEAAPMLDATRESSPCDRGTGVAFPGMRNDCSVTPLHVAYWHKTDTPWSPGDVRFGG
jgi:hypothetical protein